MRTAERFLIVDDHPMLVRGTELFLLQAREGVVIGKASALADALSMVDAPSHVLLDLQLPDARGVESIVRMHDRFPAARICAISGIDNPYLIARVAQAGATGYIPKGSPTIDDLLLRWLQDGWYFPPGVLSLPPPPRLTPREESVLQAIEWGASTKEIARRLALSPRTVDKHVESLMDKLGATNRAEAVSLARTYAFFL